MLLSVVVSRWMLGTRGLGFHFHNVTHTHIPTCLHCWVSVQAWPHQVHCSHSLASCHRCRELTIQTDPAPRSTRPTNLASTSPPALPIHPPIMTPFPQNLISYKSQPTFFHLAFEERTRPPSQSYFLSGTFVFSAWASFHQCRTPSLLPLLLTLE